MFPMRRFVEYRVPSALDPIRRVRAIPAQRTDTRIVRHLTADEQRALLDAPEPSTRLGIPSSCNTVPVAGQPVG